MDYEFTQKFGLKDPSCSLKWGWSTVHLWANTTNSCHRCDLESIPSMSKFHNTPLKAMQRTMMNNGVWPQLGCQYCQQIEKAGGISDRQDWNTSMNMSPSTLNAPDQAELLTLEIYFSNKCNMKCIYCTPFFSSSWEKEIEVHGYMKSLRIHKLNEWNSTGYEKRKKDFWDWMKNNSHTLKNYNILGGEIFYQDEFMENINFFTENPRPDLAVTVFSNFKINSNLFQNYIEELDKLRREKKVKSVQIISSIDCWGKEQEYVRYGMDLAQWESNMLMIASNYKDIIVRTNGVLSALTIKTMPEFLLKLDEIKTNTGTSVNFSHDFVVNPDFMQPQIFPIGYFDDDLNHIVKIMKTINVGWPINIKKFEKVKDVINNKPYSEEKVIQLKNYLSELDSRRGTDFRSVFPWLSEFT